MEKVFQLRIKKIISVSLTIVSFLLLLILMNLPCKDSSLSIFRNLNFQDFFESSTKISCLIFLILFFLNLISNVFIVIFSLINKEESKIFFIINAFIYLIFLTLGNINKVLIFGHNFILYTNLILLLLYLIYCLIYKLYNEKKNSLPQDENIKFNLSKTIILIIDVLSFLTIVLCLFIPFANIYKDEPLTLSPLNVLFNNVSYIEDLILLIIILIVNFISGFYLLNTINNFNNESFYKKSKKLINLNFVFSFIYLLSGIIYGFVISSLSKFKCVTFSYIPTIISSFISIIFAYFYGKNSNKEEKINAKPFVSRIESFIYALLFFGITIATLFLNIIKIKFTYPFGMEEITINGFDALTKYLELGKGLQIVSYVIYVSVIISSLLALCCIFSFASKSKVYPRIFLISIITDTVLITLIGLFGKYYEIAQLINDENIKTIIENFGISSQFDYEYKITSDAYYMFLGAVLLLAIVIIRIPYTKLCLNEEKKQTVIDNKNGLKILNNNDKKLNNNEELLKDKKNVLDQCPSFSEIDAKFNEFQNILNSKKENSFANLNLPNLVRFVVRYARESRLHLFYSYEDIAYFIASLGSSKLCILQGMSGTGKTSLPKIFLESIMGNVEIVEVESSWRDKNELLGYYNEFSKIYSPRKFTQALYRSNLNKETITFIVLDEMNLSRVEYYFSDFLSLMENEVDKRELKLLNTKIYKLQDDENKESYLALKEDHSLFVSENVWFIGTANKDESTFEISDKVYDRAMTMNFDKRAKTQITYNEDIKPSFVSFEALQEQFLLAKKTFNFNVDECELIKQVEKILIPYNISFGNRIARQIEDFVKIYCSCFDNPNQVLNEAIERILLSKVVYKLEMKNIENKMQLASEFERLKLYRIKDFVLKLNED